MIIKDNKSGYGKNSSKNSAKSAKSAKRKMFVRNFEYKIPSDPGDGMDSRTAYQYSGKPYRWWWSVVKPVRGRFVVSFVLTGISMSLATAVSVVLGWFVDDVYGKGDLSKILPYCMLIVTVPLFRSLVGILYRYLYENASQNVLMRLRAGLYHHLQDLDTPYYDKTSVGDIMARMTGDIDMVRHFTSYVLMAITEQLIIFVSGIIIMFFISWQLTLSALALAPAIILIVNRFRIEVRPIWEQVRTQYSKLNSVVQQNIGGNRVIKAFVRKDHETAKFEAENDGYRKINLKSAAVWVKYIPALDALSNMLAVPVILVGAILVVNEKMTLGGMVSFNGILFVISNPMRMMGGLFNEIQRFATSAEKIIELFMEKPRVSSPDIDDAEQTDPLNSEICGKESPEGCRPSAGTFDNETAVEFRNVSFRYFADRTTTSKSTSWDTKDEYNTMISENYALKGITFKAAKGQKIGIVGATGSGKTTLINLMMRFYDATSGTVLINGQDIREYQLDALRNHIGIVMQDLFLFSDTIEGNIAYGRPESPDEDVYNSAAIAQADGFIRSMPEGYDTIVGERGVGLSGGQRQRISLARALCFNPDILILDDTTSAIDMETEFEIQKNLNTYFSGKTVFVIAHRISSVRNADRIIVLENGEIVETGTHEELIAQKGIYYDVYLTQTGLAFESGNVGEVTGDGKE
ncbi:MAG: ABC transporter ATP-binding protein [Saccharofermentanales bacterium]